VRWTSKNDSGKPSRYPSSALCYLCPPYYAEARGVEGPRDYLHKLGTVLRELNVTEVWLDMILKRRMADEHRASRQNSCSPHYGDIDSRISRSFQ
jgi:hypothetical protein